MAEIRAGLRFTPILIANSMAPISGSLNLTEGAFSLPHSMSSATTPVVRYQLGRNVWEWIGSGTCVRGATVWSKFADAGLPHVGVEVRHLQLGEQSPKGVNGLRAVLVGGSNAGADALAI
jgi:hypothetical protein